jgi:hypothetical protein
MAAIDRLVRVGLWGPSQRNDALLRLNWLAHVVRGMSGEQGEQFLVQWSADRHNGMSKDYLTRPDQVRRHVARIVQRFDPGEAGKCIRKSCNHRPERRWASGQGPPHL